MHHVARRLGLHPTTVRYIARRYNTRAQHPPRSYHAHVKSGLIEIIVACLGRVPISTRALYDRVVDEYGSIDLRVFYEFMARMRARKQVAFEVRAARQIFYWRPGVSPLR